jgi:hypothetical protein
LSFLFSTKTVGLSVGRNIFTGTTSTIQYKKLEAGRLESLEAKNALGLLSFQAFKLSSLFRYGHRLALG